jgi:hypothetical protein
VSDIRIVVILLSVITVAGLLWNLWLTIESYYDLKSVNQRRLNGPRQILATSRYRRHVLRALKQAGIIGLWIPRVAWDHPSSPVWAFMFGLLLVSALLFETYQDWSDRHRVYWFMYIKNNRDDGL